ncbi:hypothetical protein PR048_007679 [Dryococelus australis]|uniref:Uncharacterized protein n=1 Tax=Dryococelus australis TaxID=614101 RepID=A0ABQ9HUX3_9NEOP|nr:hypothetical protein PR048_007679 [Dryococelus australis]
MQQDIAPPHFHLALREHLNTLLPEDRSFVRVSMTQWPPRSPDLTPCDLSLWGHLKDKVFVPSLPQTLPQLRQRITTAVESITTDTLHKEFLSVDTTYKPDLPGAHSPPPHHQPTMDLTEDAVKTATVTECESKENELKLRLQKLQGQLERAQRGEPFEDELPCEAELRLERQRLLCLLKKAEISRQQHPKTWKIRDSIDQLADEKYKREVDIAHLNREHEVMRCRGSACYDYEDTTLSLSDFLRKNIHLTSSKIIPQAAMDRLTKQVEGMVVKMLVLSEHVYLYKKFRSCPEILVPVDVKNSRLENVILSEYAQAKSRVEFLTDQYRKTAKDLRLAEEAVRSMGMVAGKDPPHVRKVAAKGGPSRRTPVSQPAPRKRDPQPLPPPAILAIVEEEFAELMRSAAKETAPSADVSARMRTPTRGDAVVRGPPTKEPADSERKATGQAEGQSPFRRPFRQLKQSKCPDSFETVYYVGAGSEGRPGSLVSGRNAFSFPTLHGDYWLLLRAPTRMYSSEQTPAYLATLRHAPVIRSTVHTFVDAVEPTCLHQESEPTNLLNVTVINLGMKEQGKWEIPEKTRRPAASSGTIPTREWPGRGLNPFCLGGRREV